MSKSSNILASVVLGQLAMIGALPMGKPIDGSEPDVPVDPDPHNKREKAEQKRLRKAKKRV